MNNKRYFQVHTRKGWFVAEETDNENILINLGNGRQYCLKKDDSLEAVDAKFVAKRLENIINEEKESFAKFRQYKLFIVGLFVSTMYAYGLHKGTTTITLFEGLGFIFLSLFTIQTWFSAYKSQKKIQKTREHNYYIALKRSR